VTNQAHSGSQSVVDRRRDVADAPDPRLPNSFVGAVAFTTTLVVGVGIAKTAAGTSWRVQLALMAAVVAVDCWWCRPLPSLFVATCAWLALNGLDVNGDGQLGWAGNADAVRVGVLVFVALAASCTRWYVLRSPSPPRAVIHLRQLHLVRQGVPRA
jgi:hypothetical protein